ncbi:MAG TPA: peptide chain release factor N(5)-glutamine methyltransferase [Bacteroidales bacterium]|nr:peptide chain release factor N(5)-glutamine methyltransferase [Bacteroidales bacterium]
MQRYLTYLHQTLDPIYPSAEIGALSRLLLRKLANMSTVQIYSDKDKNFPADTFEKLISAVDRLANKEPIQYILGETEFFGLSFQVGPGVLIPRPETEELVDLISSDWKDKKKNLHLLDIGTGSGCIAVSLAKTLPYSSVSAWDISEEALKIAAENAVINNVKVHFDRIDILNFVPVESQKSSLDILVSNPPYVRSSEANEMDVNVLEHEPHVALFVENSDSMLFYRIISQLAVQMLKPGGMLYYEINSDLGQETLEIVKSFSFREAKLIQDISGKDRMIRAIL